MTGRDVLVTGTGIVSSLGEGPEPHLVALAGPARPRLETERFAPYAVHPAAAVEWGLQIPKKADQRQMEAWQKLGVYAAGLALDSAGLKDDPDTKSRMQLVVAAGGGERDDAVDCQILTGLRTAADPGAYLNERLTSDLRPTLFLAQLSNLLAGNIAIVHGVTGASRTFMGEEACGVDALRIAQARIAAGQAEIMLVGGSYNAERPDALLNFALSGLLWRSAFASVWDRPAAGGGLILGSGGAFLVLESAEHAARRGAAGLARLPPVRSMRSPRPDEAGADLTRLWRESGAAADALVLSGATGVSAQTSAEHAALAALAPDATVHAVGDLVGHTLEASAPLGAVLATALLADRQAGEVVVTSVGHRRGAGLVRLTGLP
jgi:3-oxoacyl-[acyl-carrier-protein] synthase II